MSEKMVAVPQRMLDKLEESRQKLYDVVDLETTQEIMQMTNITQVMWTLANTRWKKVNTQ